MLGAEGLDVRLEKYGCCSIWLTAGTTEARSSSCVRWSTMKLLTPIARTLPSASSVSRAR